VGLQGGIKGEKRREKMIVPVDLLLLFFLMIIGIAALWTKDLLGAIVLTGAYSFVMANVWLNLGATDVAFTEAAVGAGASTALMMACLSRVPRWEK
jgi:multicomponent Na+:H+ antiporter subunit B